MSKTMQNKKHTWKKIELHNEIGWSLPARPGVYAVFFEGRLFYIGSTRNLRHRIRNHKIDFARYSHKINTPWGYADEVTIKYRLENELGEAAMVEIKLINRIKPPKNKIHI